MTTETVEQWLQKTLAAVGERLKLARLKKTPPFYFNLPVVVRPTRTRRRFSYHLRLCYTGDAVEVPNRERQVRAIAHGMTRLGISSSRRSQHGG
jgi:hypothetical protein